MHVYGAVSSPAAVWCSRRTMSATVPEMMPAHACACLRMPAHACACLRPRTLRCAHVADRISAVLINARLPRHVHGKTAIVPLFSPTAPGFIVRPSAAKVLCGYAGDGGSANKV